MLIRRSTASLFATVFVLLVMLAMVFSGCSSKPKIPDKGSKAYADTVSAFYVGLAALQVGHDVYADSKLRELTNLGPDEPAGWANWGVLALRQRNYDLAAQRLEQAHKLAPQNDQIYFLLGLLESSRGHQAEAIADLRRAVALNPRNLRAAYQLAEEIERQGGDENEAEFQRVIQRILDAQPDNLAALLEVGRVAAKRGDATTLRAAVDRISAQSSAWPPEVQQQVAALKAAAASSDPRAAATRTMFLRNVLMRVPDFRQSLAVIKAAPGEEAQPLTHFLAMETPVFKPAPADVAIDFMPSPVAGLGKGRWSWIGSIPLASAGAPAIAVANGREVHLSPGARLPFPGGKSGRDTATE